MFYYKDLNDNVHALESEDHIHLLPDGCGKITEKEAKKLSEPGKFVPASCTMAQLRISLHRENSLKTVNDHIKSMAGPEGDEARITWDFETIIRRNHSIIRVIQEVLGKTDSEMDDLFILANSL